MEQINIDTLDAKLPTLTEKYKLAKTRDIIAKVESLGYNMQKFTALKTKKEERRGHQKHRALFTSNALATEHNKEGRLQLLVTNSHDGSSSVIFQLGFFRFICSNGIVSGEFVGQPIRVRHGGDIERKIEEAVIEIAARAKLLDDAMNKMMSKQLTRDQIKEFELKAAQLRYDSANVQNVVIPTVRPQDEGDDLWRVFNRVQEGLTKGLANVTVLNDKQKLVSRKSREIKSFVRDSELNTNLFNLAMQYAA